MHKSDDDESNNIVNLSADSWRTLKVNKLAGYKLRENQPKQSIDHELPIFQGKYCGSRIIKTPATTIRTVLECLMLFFFTFIVVSSISQYYKFIWKVY